MSKSEKFVIKAMSKSQLAAAYNVRTPILRRWLMKAKSTWKILHYDNGNILSPLQVEMVVKLLGEPEKEYSE